MKFLILISSILFAQLSQAHTLECATTIAGNSIVAIYSAELDRMELTQGADGRLFGTSYDGNLKLTFNGKEVFNGAAEATAEEYGVIIKDDKLVYANMYVMFADREQPVFLTFGQSFDNRAPTFLTDSLLLGEKSDFPQPHPATCRSY